MQGNYHRQQLYPLQANNSSASSREYRQQTMALNGLPVAPTTTHSFGPTTNARGTIYPGSSSSQEFPTERQIGKPSTPSTTVSTRNQFQVNNRPVRDPLARPQPDRDLCASADSACSELLNSSSCSANNLRSGFSSQKSSNNITINASTGNSNNNNSINTQVYDKQSQQRLIGSQIVAGLQQQQQQQQHHEQYASQIRSNQLQSRFNSNSNFMPAGQADVQSATSRCHQSNLARTQGTSGASSFPSVVPGSEGRAKDKIAHGEPAEERRLHVNFNRSGVIGQAALDEAEDEPSEGRKKKYLTAKYGQQQMNLIKKRLKIEMWLFEQLQELAKGTKSEAELDEIDIDLDQLLDMDSDDTRRRWLKKTLEPFEGLPSPQVDQFIEEVLSHARLL